MTLVLELLKAQGISLDFHDSPLELLNKLNYVIDLIGDFDERQAVLARALAQFRDGQIPEVLKEFFS